MVERKVSQRMGDPQPLVGSAGMTNVSTMRLLDSLRRTETGHSREWQIGRES